MTSGLEWQAQVGKTWAENHHLTDRSFAGLTQKMLDRIGGLDGTAVLDVGCGAGELALAIARQRPGARVIGVDLSSDLVMAARERGSQHGNLDFVLADAAAWHQADFNPDLIVSRHGVMFFDEPAAAFANIRSMAVPRAALLFSCFRSMASNPWAADITRLLSLPAPRQSIAPGPFAFANPQYVEDILIQAGWSEIDFEPFDFAYVAGMGLDPVDDALQFFRRIGPAARHLRGLGGKDRDDAEDCIRSWLEDHRSGNLIAFPAAAWIVTARA